jgi:HEAT repeat protein
MKTNLVYLLVETQSHISEEKLVASLCGLPERVIIQGIKVGSAQSRAIAIMSAHERELVSEEVRDALLSALERPMAANSITRDNTVAVRSTAARALAIFPEDRSVQGALFHRAVGNDLPQVTRAACASLAKMKCSYVTERAMDLLRSGDPSENLVGAFLLGEFGHEPAELFILNLIQKRPGLARSFIRALGKFDTKRALDALLVYATHRDWEYREAAVSALAQTIDRRDVRTVLDKALKDTRQQVRIAAMQAYAQTGRAYQMDLVLSWLEAESFVERRAAAEAMVHFAKRQEASAHLEILAHDEREHVAGAAVYALRYFPNERSVRAILHVIEHASDFQIRAEALESLRQNACTESVLFEMVEEALKPPIASGE